MKKLIIALSSVVLVGTVAFADPHEEREDLMKSFGKALGSIAPMAQGKADFDAAKVQSALAELNTQVKKFDVAVLFPEGSATKGTSPKIWENMDDFKAHVAKLQADVGEAAAAPAMDIAALQAQLGKIGGDCGSCHEVYRLKD
ncbi:MAG: cytochrome c [Rhizobiaceae bacterium]|nr:cytochrome c [Rhizobiaceae bacterium]